MISAGAYDYPYEQAMQIAYDTCKLFLNRKQVKLDIFIVLYQGPENLIGKKNKIDQLRHSEHENFLRVAEYIKKHYYPVMDDDYFDLITTVDDAARQFAPQRRLVAKKARKIEIEFPIAETFSQMLLRLMKEHNMTAPELYNDACVDRKLFSKIKNNDNYQPKKYIAVSFALALQLSLDDTKKLLESAGYALSRSNFKDLVISSCIEQNIRSVWGVNEMLEEWGLPELIKI